MPPSLRAEMTEEELKNRIGSRQGLRRVRETLSDEISFRADGPARLDPITILTIISIVIQVIAYCREKNSDEDIIAAIKNAKTLPLRKTIKLRRKLKALQLEEDLAQPIYDSTIDVAEGLSDAEIADLIELAIELNK